jgi:hypothetical protein
LSTTDVYVLGGLVLVAWVSTIVGLVWLVLGVAKAALARARAQDVPAVLLGLTRMVSAVPWLGQLTQLVRSAIEAARTGATPQASTGREVTSPGPTMIDGSSTGGAQ